MAMKQDFPTSFSVSYAFKGSTTHNMELIMNPGSEATCTQVGHVLRQLICGKLMRKIDGCFVVLLKGVTHFFSRTHFPLNPQVSH